MRTYHRRMSITISLDYDIMERLTKEENRSAFINQLLKNYYKQKDNENKFDGYADEDLRLILTKLEKVKEAEEHLKELKKDVNEATDKIGLDLNGMA